MIAIHSGGPLLRQIQLDPIIDALRWVAIRALFDYNAARRRKYSENAHLHGTRRGQDHRATDGLHDKLRAGGETRKLHGRGAPAASTD